MAIATAPVSGSAPGPAPGPAPIPVSAPIPTGVPTGVPTSAPTGVPTGAPTSAPTGAPTSVPTATGAPGPTPSYSLLNPPAYTLSRVVNSVPELWREWTQGLSGQPSVQSLEDQFGTAWRPEPKEKTYFSRRKVIIDCIRTAIARGESSASAVTRLETLRMEGNWSLSKLYTLLSKRELAFP
jgi:hypothetical protein